MIDVGKDLQRACWDGYEDGKKEANAEVAKEIFNKIIPILMYTTFSSELAKKSTLDYVYALKKDFTGGE